MKKMSAEKEKVLVDAMIGLYAKAHSQDNQGFDAELLKAYAHKQIAHCR